MRRVNELLNLAVERSTEKFPHKKIEPVTAYWDRPGAYRCSLWVDNALVFGYGKSMNECCENLLNGIDEAETTEREIYCVI
jgi:hypothetical protein